MIVMYFAIFIFFKFFVVNIPDAALTAGAAALALVRRERRRFLHRVTNARKVKLEIIQEGESPWDAWIHSE